MARSRSAGAMTKAGRWRFCITKNASRRSMSRMRWGRSRRGAQSHRLSQANFRCSKEVRPEEASSGQVDDQNWLATRRPGGLETSSSARDARPTGGSDA
jgi:hypothetical protein